MDTPVVTPQLLPRLRVLRAPPSGRLDNHNTSVTSSQAGPSRLTDFTQLVDLNLSDIRAAHDYTDEDEEQDQYPTPRMNTPAPLTTSSATPTPSLAGRLRELIHLVPNGSGSQATPTIQRPPSPTFHESDFEGEMSTAGRSHARDMVHSIFSRARREPGDTPQKGKQRGNSGNSDNESDTNPTSSREWFDSKGKRKSLSDEESDNSKTANGSSYSNGSSQRSILRSSRDTHTIEFPLKAISADDDDSDDAEERPRRISPSNATSAPLQSLRISQNSSFPQHSNLLDQDSEMQHAFGEFDSFGEPSAHLHKPRESTVREGGVANVSAVTPGPSGESSAAEKSRSPISAIKAFPSSRLNHSSTSITARNQLQEERSTGINGKDTRQRRTSLQGYTPPSVKHKSSSSLQFSDQSSAMSVSDYNERMRDMGHERNREREREWNKRHPKNVRPNSSLSFHSPRPEHRSRTSSISSLESPRPGSALSNMSMESADSPRTRVRTISGLNDQPRAPSLSGSSRPGSALSNHSSPVPDFPQGLRRHQSLTSRSDSPASVNSISSKDEVVAEVQHERERNWNAPRPKWHRRSLPNTPNRPESPITSKMSSPHSPSDYRREHTTSTPAAPKEALGTPRSDSRSSLPRRRSLQSKAIPLSPSPAERRHSSLVPVANSPNSSRLSTVVTSTPARPRSPLPRPVPQTKPRLQPSTKRGHESNMETPKAVPDIQIQDGTEDMQEKLTFAFPRSTNGVSLSQESMELTEAYNAREATTLPSFSDSSHHLQTPNNDTMHTASLLGPNGTQTSMQEIYEGSEDALEQERTPILQTINPPAEESQLHESQESSSLMHITREIVESVQEEPEFSDSRYVDSHQSSTPSFLLTPPRSRHSFSSSLKHEFQTPSPPKGLPELPEPPSLSSDGETGFDSLPQIGTNLSPGDITPANGGGNGSGNFTALKTPKPPGAWFATPAPSTRTVAENDSAENFIDSSDIDLPVSKPSQSQSIFPQTPAPPGGWMYTPAARQRAYSDPKSKLNEGDLTTPAAPSGRAHTMPSKIPIGVDGWANTPGTVRKSILKVRFDPDVIGQGHESSDAIPDSIVSQIDRPSATAKPSSGDVRPTTPEPVRPVTPPPSRSPRKHKRSPSVRVVDAYGNEQKDSARKRDAPSPTPSTPRSRSGIRIVDALGQEVKEELVPKSEVVEEKAVEHGQVVPLTRVEALQRVRQGIQELAEGIESLDLMSPSREDDSVRIKELDEASRALKQSREQLARDVHKAENELKRQIRQLVLARKWLGGNFWFLFCVGVVQVLLIFVMYRASVLRARKMFLTNYYDPFNPDLFLYTTNPDTQYTTPTSAWSLVTQAFHRRDLTTFTGAIRENLSVLIKKWHQEMWDVWGDDPSRPVGAWPPT